MGDYDDWQVWGPFLYQVGERPRFSNSQTLWGMRSLGAEPGSYSSHPARFPIHPSFPKWPSVELSLSFLLLALACFSDNERNKVFCKPLKLHGSLRGKLGTLHRFVWHNQPRVTTHSRKGFACRCVTREEIIWEIKGHFVYSFSIY